MRHASRRLAAIAALAGAVGWMACRDSNVPFLTAPTTVANTPTGLQNAVTGLFFAARLDVGPYILTMTGFGRDAGNFTNTEPRWVTEGLGIVPLSSQSVYEFFMWDQEFANAKLANDILASLPAVRPAYTPAQAAAVTGVVQTIKAMQFMLVAETHDTAGAPVASIASATPAPILCNADVWRYIVALLDSGNAALNVAGGIPLPITLPSGFGSVSAAAGPSSSSGAFAAFNRALAGKAGLELAYAIARGGAGAPTSTTPGTPDATALQRADSAIHASALFSPPAITTPSPNGFSTADPYGVYYVWSGQSGDVRNPVVGNLGTYAVLWDFVTDVDTLDARWRAKFSVNPNQVQEQSFNAVASPYIYSYYTSPASPIPIVRNEELALVEAQIQLGLGHYPQALALINIVHQQAGGFATPLAAPADYLHVRDALLKEQRISTVYEASGDRPIALRMYGLAATADTTWSAHGSGPDSTGTATAASALGGAIADQHSTLIPLPQSEIDGRHGARALVCP